MQNRQTPRLRAALAVPVLLLTSLFIACDGGNADVTEGEAERTATPRPQIGTLPTMEPSPSGSPTGTATAGDPAGTPADEGDVGWGVVTVEVETGEVAVLYDGLDTFRPGLGVTFAPWPEARNNGIWLSPTTEEAVRYGLDGEVEERIDGWGVIESADGRARSYFIGDTEGSVMLVVEGAEGEPVEIEGANASNRTFSPDGSRLAWLDSASAEMNRVMMLELGTGEVTEVATVSPCACDGYHYIEWSPSSRYLAYENPDYGNPSERGVYIRDTQADGDGDASGEPESIRLAGASPVGEGWIEADETEFLLTLDDRVPTLHPVEDDREPVVIDVDEAPGSLRASSLQGLVRVAFGTGTEATTLIFDPVSGEQLRELRGESHAVLTEDGIATAAVTRNDIACTGIEVDHPDFEERLDCNAEYVRWSPDGRYLALVPQAVTAPVEILDVTTGETTEVPHAGPRDVVPDWSEDGRYLVWVWGDAL